MKKEKSLKSKVIKILILVGKNNFNIREYSNMKTNSMIILLIFAIKTDLKLESQITITITILNFFPKFCMLNSYTMS